MVAISPFKTIDHCEAWINETNKRGGQQTCDWNQLASDYGRKELTINTV